MITGAAILDLVLKWLIPFICVALMGFLTVRFVKPWKVGNENERLKEWEHMAQKSDKLSQMCNRQVQTIQASSEKTDAKIMEMVDAMKEEFTVARQDVLENRKEMNGTLNLLRIGLVDIHLQNLIRTCEKYIKRGYITPIELEHYKERLKIYHDLGGNGHMDTWDKLIQELPHREIT